MLLQVHKLRKGYIFRPLFENYGQNAGAVQRILIYYDSAVAQHPHERRGYEVIDCETGELFSYWFGNAVYVEFNLQSEYACLNDLSLWDK